MKIKNKINITHNDDNLLPLVNIIFLLLIFFMIAGVIAKQKEMYDVDLATAVIDKYSEALDKFSSKKKSSIKWGERVRDPNAMNLITIDDVKAKIKEIIKK